MSGKTTLNVPEGFADILQDLTREVLRNQPQDIIAFCASYFKEKVDKGEPGFSKKIAVSEDQDDMTAKDTGIETPADDSEFPASDSDMDEPAAPPQPSSYNRNRRASVSAESMAPTTDEAYEKIIIPKSDEQKERIRASIANNFLFKNLDEDQYKDVVNAMAEKRVEAGEEVIVQGGVGDYFYVVETGTLDVYVSREQGRATRGNKVYDYSAGGSFGELALMYNAPRAATVVSTSSCTLWALDRVTFRRILMENTSRKRRMYESFLEELPLLVSLEPYERHKIADALESLTFNDGDVVVKQGDPGDAFYIIESGEASVIVTDEEGVEHEMPGLKKGDYFGELALLTDKPRVATVKAKGRLKCATLGKKAFVRLLGPVVEIIKRNTASYKLISRRKDITDALAELGVNLPPGSAQ